MSYNKHHYCIPVILISFLIYAVFINAQTESDNQILPYSNARADLKTLSESFRRYRANHFDESYAELLREGLKRWYQEYEECGEHTFPTCELYVVFLSLLEPEFDMNVTHEERERRFDKLDTLFSNIQSWIINNQKSEEELKFLKRLQYRVRYLQYRIASSEYRTNFTRANHKREGNYKRLCEDLIKEMNSTNCDIEDTLEILFNNPQSDESDEYKLYKEAQQKIIKCVTTNDDQQKQMLLRDALKLFRTFRDTTENDRHILIQILRNDALFRQLLIQDKLDKKIENDLLDRFINNLNPPALYEEDSSNYQKYIVQIDNEINRLHRLYSVKSSTLQEIIFFLREGKYIDAINKINRESEDSINNEDELYNMLIIAEYEKYKSMKQLNENEFIDKIIRIQNNIISEEQICESYFTMGYIYDYLEEWQDAKNEFMKLKEKGAPLGILYYGNVALKLGEYEQSMDCIAELMNILKNSDLKKQYPYLNKQEKDILRLWDKDEYRRYRTLSEVKNITHQPNDNLKEYFQNSFFFEFFEKELRPNSSDWIAQSDSIQKWFRPPLRINKHDLCILIPIEFTLPTLDIKLQLSANIEDRNIIECDTSEIRFDKEVRIIPHGNGFFSGFGDSIKNAFTITKNGYKPFSVDYIPGYHPRNMIIPLEPIWKIVDEDEIPIKTKQITIPMDIFVTEREDSVFVSGYGGVVCIDLDDRSHPIPIIDKPNTLFLSPFFNKVDSSVFYSNFGRNRIEVFNLGKRYKGKRGYKENIIRPAGLVVFNDVIIIACDESLPIKAFRSSDFEEIGDLSSIMGKGLYRVEGLVLSPDQKSIYMCDPILNCIHKFTIENTRDSLKFNHTDTRIKNNLNIPIRIAIDKDNYLYVVDRDKKIKIFKDDIDQMIASIDNDSFEKVTMKEPFGIAVVNKTIYVVDRDRQDNKIIKFRINWTDNNSSQTD